MINNRRGKTLSTNIPIHTLSGGVGRQAPSKRLPSESQELVNALVTVERSIEKRPGTDLMPVIGFGGTDNYTGDELGLDPNGTYEFFWHSLSDDARFLFVVDRSATTSGEKLFYTFFYNQTLDRFEDHTQQNQVDSDADPANVVDPDVRAYITHGSSPLKLVSRGQNLVFLNPDAYAGYTSVQDGSNWKTVSLSGQTTGTDDDLGLE